MIKFALTIIVNLFYYSIIKIKLIFKKTIKKNSNFSIMVIAPHQDDEVVGAGGKIIQTIKNGDEVFVIYVTNSISKQYVENQPFPRFVKFLLTKNRKIESKMAMMIAGVPLNNLYFLNYNARILEEYSNYPNPELTDILMEIKNNICNLIETLKPNELYVSAYEGGHCDHDLINAIVSSIRAEQKYNKVYEMPFYPTNYPEYMKGPKNGIYQEFIPSDRDQLTTSYKIISLELNDEEKKLKSDMLKVFRSQNPFLIHFMSKPDKFRLFPKYDYTKPPHTGELYIKGNLLCDITFDDFKNAISTFLKD